MADFGATELEAFRTEARTWLEENYPASLRGHPEQVSEAMNGGGKPTGDVELWRQRMGEKGWGVPTWPKQYGGGGLTPAEARVLVRGDGAASAPPTRSAAWASSCSARRCWSTATRRRCSEHMPPIARGEIRWCQGYSEPGAGSDLASPADQAEDKGDHWLINGQKIWTSDANKADWCFCLVRTDPKAQQARGHQLRPDRHAPAGRRDAADPADLRRLAVLRDLLHRREGPRRRTWSAS